jgi:hypothetical protein
MSKEKNRITGGEPAALTALIPSPRGVTSRASLRVLALVLKPTRWAATHVTPTGGTDPGRVDRLRRDLRCTDPGTSHVTTPFYVIEGNCSFDECGTQALLLLLTTPSI